MANSPDITSYAIEAGKRGINRQELIDLFNNQALTNTLVEQEKAGIINEKNKKLLREIRNFLAIQATAEAAGGAGGAEAAGGAGGAASSAKNKLNYLANLASFPSKFKEAHDNMNHKFILKNRAEKQLNDTDNEISRLTRLGQNTSELNSRRAELVLQFRTADMEYKHADFILLGSYLNYLDENISRYRKKGKDITELNSDRAIIYRRVDVANKEYIAAKLALTALKGGRRTRHNKRAKRSRKSNRSKQFK